MVHGVSYLGKCTVIPKVAFMGKTITNIAEFALLDVLLDWVQGFLLGDLSQQLVSPGDRLIGNLEGCSERNDLREGLLPAWHWSILGSPQSC